jgi:hypothetical protein
MPPVPSPDAFHCVLAPHRHGSMPCRPQPDELAAIAVAHATRSG